MSNKNLYSNIGILGERIMIRSCGMEGFKNTRKGTNIAAQATAIGLATVSIYYFLKILTNFFLFVLHNTKVKYITK